VVPDAVDAWRYEREGGQRTFFVFDFCREREGEGERGGGREVGRKISPIRFLPPFSPDFFSTKQQQWI